MTAPMHASPAGEATRDRKRRPVCPILLGAMLTVEVADLVAGLLVDEEARRAIEEGR